MRVARVCAGALLFALACNAHAKCKILQAAEWPVSHTHNRPVIERRVNGQPVRILLDTGAQLTFLWRSAAVNIGLPVVDGAGTGLRMFGVGGEKKVMATTIKELQVAAYKATRMQLLALGEADEKHDQAMVLGYDFFSHLSTEFDLAHGVIRLLEPRDCQADQMAYWSDTYSLAELSPGQARRIELDLIINGKHVKAILDTGAPVTILDLAAAQRLDLKRAPAASGEESSSTWVGIAQTVSIGDETIRNVPVRVQDMFSKDTVTETGSRINKEAADFPGMLLGFDFLLSHHVLVLPKMHAMVFTYNGGPPFPGIDPDLHPAAQTPKAP